jgi:hypothetical protein
MFGLIVLVGLIADGVNRWHVAQGEGVEGTLTVEGTTEIHYGKPPSTTAFVGTFVSEDGTVTRSVRLGEGSPAGTDIGDQLDVLWTEDDPGLVFLADTRAFRNWVESMIFLVVWFTGMAVVALVIRSRRRRPRPEEDDEPVEHAPEPPPPVSASQQLADRRAQLSKDLDLLKAELETIRSRSGNGNASITAGVGRGQRA